MALKEAGIVAAIEDPCAIAVGGELEGDENPFAILESEENQLYLCTCVYIICP